MLTLLRFLRSVLKGNRPYVLSLILLNLFFFSDVLLTGNTFFYRDIGHFHQPLKKLVTEAYSRGEWPLWNPYIQFGQPLLANSNSMAVYPTQILFHLFPFDWAFDVNLVVHCFIAGLGAFYLARTLTLTPVAAFVVAIAYNFSGVVLSFVNLPNLAGTAALLPWVAFLLRKVVRGPIPANVACSSLTIGLFLLLVEPVTFMASLLFLLPLTVYAWLTRPAGVSSRVTAGGLLIALISGFGLAAVQLLPAQELLQSSGRNQGLDFARASFWSVHPVSLTQLLFPGVWKDPFNLSNLFTSWSDAFFGRREPYLVSCYCGLGCLVLALLGLFFSKKIALKWIMVAVSLTALLLALGKYTPLYSFLYDCLPPFRFGRYPAKYFLTATLGFALLAGLGIDEIGQLRSYLSGSQGKRRLFIYLLLISGLLAASVVLTLPWLWQTAGAQVKNDEIQLNYQGAAMTIGKLAVRHSALYLWLVVLTAAGLILFASFSTRVRASWLARLAALLILFDLFSNHWINPVVDSGVYKTSPVTEWLLKQTFQEGPFRVHQLPPRRISYSISGKSDSLTWYFLFQRLSASPYTAAGDHLEYSTFQPIDGLETYASQIIDLKFKQATEIEQKLDHLARLNTRYVLSMEPIRSPLAEWRISFRLNSNRLLHIYRLKNAFPRAFLASMKAANLKEGEYEIENGFVPPSDHSVRVASHDAGRVDAVVTAVTPSLMVLLDSYYPGWRVWVDGHEHKIERVNRAFRGVIVQPGQHEVAFRYDPKSFRYGLAVTLSTIAAWAAAFIFLHWRRHPARKKQPAPVSETEEVVA